MISGLLFSLSPFMLLYSLDYITKGGVKRFLDVFINEYKVLYSEAKDLIKNKEWRELI